MTASQIVSPYVKARCGDREGALRELASMEQDQEAGRGNPRNVARGYLGLGDKQRALDWLERAQKEGWWNHSLAAPDWDPLRGDPRFEKIVASLAPKQ